MSPLTRLLTSHVSPVLAYVFLAVPWRSLRDHSRLRTSLTLTSTTSRRIFPTYKRRSSALRTRTSCLAIWPSPPSTGGYEPKKFDKITSVDNDTTHIDDPDHDIHDFSKIKGKTLDNSVFPQCLNSLFRTFLMGDFVLREKAKKACNRETVAGQREREEREGLVINATRNRIRSHSPTTHRQFDSDDRDFRVHMEWRAQQATLGENSAQKNFLDWVRDGDRKFGTKKFRTHNIWVTTRAWISKKIFNVQIKLSVRGYICVANWRWRIVFSRIATQEVAKNLKNWEYAAIRKKILKKQRWWNNLLCKMIKNHVQWVYSSTILTDDLRSSSSCYLKFVESLAAKLECHEIHEKIWDSWKRFWLSTCSTRSWWITQWFKEFGDIIGHSENRRNWGKGERRTIAVNTFILFSGKSKTKNLDGGKRPLFMTGHVNSELSPLGNAPVIPWPNKISEPNCEFPSRSLRKGS